MTKNHPNKAALLIGINEYHNSDVFKSLPQVKNNIQELHEILSNPHLGGYNIDDKHHVMDNTASDIEKKIKAFIKENKNSSILIYYTGHGLMCPQNDVFWITAKDSNKDVDGTADYCTFIQSTPIIKCIINQKPKELVMILDCCYAAAFINNFQNELNKSPKCDMGNFTIIASCGANERIYLQDKDELTPFVKSFSKRIYDSARNNSMSVNANDMFNYYRKNVYGNLSPKIWKKELSENSTSGFKYSPPVISNIRTKEIELKVFIHNLAIKKNDKLRKEELNIIEEFNRKKLFLSEERLATIVNSYYQDIQEKEVKKKELEENQINQAKNERETLKSIWKIAKEKYEYKNEQEFFAKMLCEELCIKYLDLSISEGNVKVKKWSLISLMTFLLISWRVIELLPSQNPPLIYYNRLSSKKILQENTLALSISVSPDERSILMLSRDGKLGKRSLDSEFPNTLPGEFPTTLPGEKIKIASYTSTGEIQVISTDKMSIKIHKFNKFNKKSDLSIPLESNADDYIFSADDKTLVAISRITKSIEIFNLETGEKMRKKSPTTKISNISNVIIKNEFIIVAGEKDSDENHLDKSNLDKGSKDGDDIRLSETILGKGGIEVFNWKKNELIIENNDHSNEVTAMAISGNGNTLISSSAAAGQIGGEIRVWDLVSSIESKKLIPKFKGVQSTNAALSSIATNNEGDTMTVSSAEDKIQIRLTSSKDGYEKVIDGDSNQINSLVFNLKGDMLFSSDLTGRIIQYNLEKN
jgi:hypothetical protein